MGFEFPSDTLEILEREDSTLVEALKELWARERCEIVVSGYVQQIFPLIPAEVNARNLSHPHAWQEVPFAFTAHFAPGRACGPLGVRLDGREVEAQAEEAETFRDGSLRRARLVIRPRVGGGAIAQGELVWGRRRRPLILLAGDAEMGSGRNSEGEGEDRWRGHRDASRAGLPLRGPRLAQDEAVSLGVSSHHCLGATEGWVDLSDGQRGVAVITNKSQLFSVPLLHFEELDDSFLLRVYTSIGESDDTAEAFWRGHNEITVTYLGHHGGDLEAVQRQSAMINGGLLAIFPAHFGLIEERKEITMD